jgi:hypothetical protein
MPISHLIDHNRRLAICRVWGVLTDADLQGHYASLAADPEFHPDYRQLSNLGDVQQVVAGQSTIASVASLSVFRPGTRRALVAPSDAAFGLSRMFATYAEDVGQNVHVFRTETEAVAWLQSP